MNQPIHNDYWLSRFESILNSALVQHRAVSLIRVDLRFPEYMPVTIMDPDPDSAVISRFFASLKAKIQAYQRKKRWANQRVHATSLRYFWCRECIRTSTRQRRVIGRRASIRRCRFTGRRPPGKMDQAIALPGLKMQGAAPCLLDHRRQRRRFAEIPERAPGIFVEQ